MQSVDLNLLAAVDVLLREQSVSIAGQKLGLSAPAMSRTLQRARRLFKDPLLVRAGNRLVPTPRALELRQRLQPLVEEARSISTSKPESSLAEIDRIFTIRADESFAVAFAAKIMELLHAKAPLARLRFLGASEDGTEALRAGSIDLDISPNQVPGPELKVQLLHRVKFIGACRAGHNLQGRGIVAEEFASETHVAAGRRGKLRGPIDVELEKLGPKRQIGLWVPTFFPALQAAASSEMVASIPQYFQPIAVSLFKLHTFRIPLDLPIVAVYQLWHPRMDSDPAHQFLRACVRIACRQKD